MPKYKLDMLYSDAIFLSYFNLVFKRCKSRNVNTISRRFWQCPANGCPLMLCQPRAKFNCFIFKTVFCQFSFKKESIRFGKGFNAGQFSSFSESKFNGKRHIFGSIQLEPEFKNPIFSVTIICACKLCLSLCLLLFLSSSNGIS